MGMLTVTAKGQVTLRKEVLRHLGAAPGTKLAIETLPDGRIELRVAPTGGRIGDVFDLLKRADRPVLSIEEMERIAAAGWAGTP
jgi:AbrB family looped-hinge helix DNA binding protein